VRKLLARVGVLWAAFILSGIALAQTLIQGQTYPGRQTVNIQVDDGGRLITVAGSGSSSSGGTVTISNVPLPVTIVDGGAGSTFSTFPCVDVTCGPAPTLLSETAGQMGLTFSSLLPGNPPVVLGLPSSVDAGAGDLLLASVADLTIPVNGTAVMACETFQSDGGALISVCTRGP
jgi:hypothetical protein